MGLYKSSGEVERQRWKRYFNSEHGLKLLRYLTALALASMVAMSLACSPGSHDPRNVLVPGGNVQRGKKLIGRMGCGACHVIPGIRAARGRVGPPLYDFGDRVFIAGELPNTPANLMRWIENPPAVKPHTAMPDLGVTKNQARDMTAYLYSLRK